VIQLTWLQWLLVMIGMALSGTVLVMTVSPAFKNDKKQVFIISMVFVMAMHGLLAIGFMLYFFHVPKIDMSDLYTTASPFGNVTASSMATSSVMTHSSIAVNLTSG
jgi:fatty acid desaturase